MASASPPRRRTSEFCSLPQPVILRSTSSKAPVVTPPAQLRRYLQGEAKRLNILPDLRQNPWNWGLTVSKVLALHDHIQDDLQLYCNAHEADDQFRHVCSSPDCSWDHINVRHALGVTHQGSRRPLIGNMHVVVQRYIRPWTAPYHVSYSGLMLAEEAAQKKHTTGSLSKACETEVFISHCWNEDFADFVQTLNASLDPSTVVWICSLSIDQNANIASEIGGDLDSCPFARALRGAKRVLVVMDPEAEPLERVWCVLEAHFAFLWEKPYDIALPDDNEERSWQLVDRKLSQLDVRACHATDPADRDRILAFVSEHGKGVDSLNRDVQQVSARAAQQASAFAAAASGRLRELAEMEEFLLFRTNSRERLPLHIAAASNHAQALTLIIERTKGSLTNAGDCDSRTPLSVAAEVGAVDSVKALLTLRANLDCASGSDAEKRSVLSGSLPLHMASFQGHRDVIILLLEACTCINSTTSSGYTPVHLASLKLRVEATRLLLQLRGNPNCSDRSGFTPLHDVDSKGGDEATEVLEALVRYRAFLDAINNDGRTPVFVAAQAGKTRALSYLLDAKADFTISNKKGYSPLHVAAEKGNVKSIQALVHARANLDQMTQAGNTPLKVAFMYGRKQTATWLLELRADPDARGDGSSTALHLVAKKGRVEHVRLLLKVGASLDACCKDGQRPWAAAASAGHQETLKLLLEHMDCLKVFGTSVFLEALTDLMLLIAQTWENEQTDSLLKVCISITEALHSTRHRDALVHDSLTDGCGGLHIAGPEYVLRLSCACAEVSGPICAAKILRHAAIHGMAQTDQEPYVFSEGPDPSKQH